LRRAFSAHIRRTSGLQSQCKACELETKQKWYQNNKDIARERENLRRKTDKFKNQFNEYRKKRRATDSNYKIKDILRNRLKNALRSGKHSKANTTITLLGCNISFFRTYIESKFKPCMSWKNHGKWHLDHIIPCASFDFNDPEQQKKCFHYTNMQPLWADENLQKSNKLDWKPADANA
jgi:hypothetical protein